MNCNTCNDTKAVYNEQFNGFQNCPDCSPVHAAPLPPIPEPDIMILHCASVQISGNPDGEPPIMALINAIDYDEVLRQVPIAEAVRYYGAHNLLVNMEAGEIKEYMQA